jgi:hypothetical protein
VNPAAREMLDLPAKNLIGLLMEKELSNLPDLIRIYQKGKMQFVKLLLKAMKSSII